jgi:hypothetical protein
MAISEHDQRGYLDVLTLMRERTGAQIDALRRINSPWHVYEGADNEKEVSQQLLQELERQQADLEYLIKSESSDV